jgi:hypothetical protein
MLRFYKILKTSTENIHVNTTGASVMRIGQGTANWSFPRRGPEIESRTTPATSAAIDMTTVMQNVQQLARIDEQVCPDSGDKILISESDLMSFWESL